MGSKTERKRELNQKHRAWSRALIDYTGLKPTPLAKNAGLSDTALTRILDEDYPGTLSADTIEALKSTYGVPGPDEFGSGLARGFGEAAQVDLLKEPDNVATVMRAMIRGRNAVDVWRLTTDALVDAGYLPGDLVAVAIDVEPKARDAVCAQVYDLGRMRADTVWRVYDPPFLVAAARDRTRYKPLLVDADRVVIKGVIVGSARPWRSSNT